VIHIARGDNPVERVRRGTLGPMTDWAAWGTAVGTLVLAGATFVAVRSSNRSARIAERKLLAGLRPTLTPSRPEDPSEQVQYADGRVFDVVGGRAMVHEEDGVIYLAIPLRNVGAGIALLQGYRLEAETSERVARDPRGPARHRRGDAPLPTSRASPSNSVTCTSRPGASASGRRHCATQATSATRKRAMRLRLVVGSRSTCSTPITMEASRRSRGSCCFQTPRGAGAAM